jgi:hypothetical protein
MRLRPRNDDGPEPGRRAGQLAQAIVVRLGAVLVLGGDERAGATILPPSVGVRGSS